MTSDQLQQIFDEEMSSLKKALLYIAVIVVVLVLVLYSFLNWGVPRTPSTSDVSPKVADKAPPIEKPSGQQPSVKARRSKAGSVDWRDKHNWRKNLRIGLSRTEVRQLFGEAETIEVVSNSETWWYGLGSISFVVDKDSPDGRLDSWFEAD
jgi:hypothetical protein